MPLCFSHWVTLQYPVCRVLVPDLAIWETLLSLFFFPVMIPCIFSTMQGKVLTELHRKRLSFLLIRLGNLPRLTSCWYYPCLTMHYFTKIFPWYGWEGVGKKGLRREEHLFLLYLLPVCLINLRLPLVRLDFIQDSKEQSHPDIVCGPLIQQEACGLHLPMET